MQVLLVLHDSSVLDILECHLLAFWLLTGFSPKPFLCTALETAQAAVNKILAPGKFPLVALWMKESGNIVCFTPSEMDTFDGNFSVAPPASLESGYAPLWPDSDYAQVIYAGEVLGQK